MDKFCIELEYPSQMSGSQSSMKDATVLGYNKDRFKLACQTVGHRWNMDRGERGELRDR